MSAALAPPAAPPAAPAASPNKLAPVNKFAPIPAKIMGPNSVATFFKKLPKLPLSCLVKSKTP